MSIKNNRAADLLCSAFEGGSNYWYLIVASVDSTDNKQGKPWGEEYTPSYIGLPFSKDGAVLIRDCEDEEGDIYRLDFQSVIKGKKILATNPDYSRYYCDVVNENDDAETGDIFLQLCLFGEVIYG